MIFKNLRLSARYGKAHGLLLRGEYDRSYELLKSIIEAGPEEYMLPLIHDDLGYIEYKRGNFEESMKHMDFCIVDSVKNPEMWDFPEAVSNIERVHWYYKKSEQKLKQERT